MIEVRQTAAFALWFRRLKDMRAKAQIVRRIERAQIGHLGDAVSVGEGVSEMRIHHGPGYRLYFVQQGAAVIILLCGGDKSSQNRDIRAAKALAIDMRAGEPGA